MDVVGSGIRERDIDYIRQSRYIDASSSYIGGDKEAHVPVFERLEVCAALLYRPTASKDYAGESVLFAFLSLAFEGAASA